MRLLFKADSGGAATCIYCSINVREGRKTLQSTKFFWQMLCLYSVSKLCPGGGGAKLILIKCMSNFGQRAGCRLQMTAINCEHRGKNAEEGLRAKKLPPFSPRRRGFETEYSGKRPTMNRPRMFSSCSNECRCHAVCTLRFSRAPPIALFTPIFATQPRSL